jgi:hypothetical protein
MRAGTLILLAHCVTWCTVASSSSTLSVATRRTPTRLFAEQESWKGDVVSGGVIQGCSVTQVEGSLTEWTIQIDGVEADLGRFSTAIYKKLIQDAKQQRFQGFRPGTIPPHLESTYRAFAMDECARETVMEAMQQNNVRPFDKCRDEIVLGNFFIPPSEPSTKKKKKSRKRNSEKDASHDEPDDALPTPMAWRTFDSMKDAITAGWRPGQSFSFKASGVKGQKVAVDSAASASRVPGIKY